MKYRVGDFVMVKPTIEVGIYGNETGPKECHFAQGMLKYRGRVFQIREVTPYHRYTLDGIPYYWVDEMLDPACEPVDLDGLDFNDLGKELFGD